MGIIVQAFELGVLFYENEIIFQNVMMNQVKEKYDRY